jgi:sialic acid synthase SpsE|tara:strand:- start:377 stop:1159 length:783 start_codon:yes stop_codon:yes gene_type:complete
MNSVPNLILEVGINHFGDIKKAKEIINFFIKSKFTSLTFMLHTEDFCKKYLEKKKIDFILPKSFYEFALKVCKKNKKKLGLSVCDVLTYDRIKDLNFDFYKILGIAINNKELLKQINSKKKPVYISLAKGSDSKIKKCLKYFSNKKNLNLIYTSMSYDPKDTNLNRITHLKKKFNLPVGYGHHYKNLNTFILSTFFKPNFYFFYIKGFFKNPNTVYPDDQHAIFIKDLLNLNDLIVESDIIINNKKNNISIKLNDENIKI